MIAFPSMLLEPASQAGIKIPNLDNKDEDFDEKEYPHFSLFCKAQLGQPMPSWTAHWENAHVIAKLDRSELKTITWGQLQEKGFQLGHPLP